MPAHRYKQRTLTHLQSCSKSSKEKYKQFMEMYSCLVVTSFDSCTEIPGILFLLLCSLDSHCCKICTCFVFFKSNFMFCHNICFCAIDWKYVYFKVCILIIGRVKESMGTNNWSVHNNWIKRDQLDVTCFIISLFNAQHVSDVNTSTLRSLRLICWVISWVVSGSMCVGVTLQCGCGGVVSR